MSTPNIDRYIATYVRMHDIIDGYRRYIKNNDEIPYSEVHKNICKILDRTHVPIDTTRSYPKDFIFNNNDLEKLEADLQKTTRFICNENLYTSMQCIADLTTAMIGFVIFQYLLFISLQKLDRTDENVQFDNLRFDMFQIYVIGHDADANKIGSIVGKRGRWVRAFFKKKNDDLSPRDIGIMAQALRCELSVSVTAREDEKHA